MSSHHIVREKQEPALLVAGLDNFSDEELGQLLEWSPTVIATLTLAEQLAVYGIKVDGILADQVTNFEQADVKLITLGNQHWLQAALTYLVEQNYPAVNIVTDELDLAVYEEYVAKINLVIFYNKQKIYPVNSGFTKWRPAGELVQVLTPEPIVEARNLQQTAPQQYQTIADGLIGFTFNAPYAFISEVY
jgi:thiamine pyrophosphokinase